MPNRHSLDNTNPGVSDDVFEENTDVTEEEESQMERDLATEEFYDTQHGDGHTMNPQQAWEQGLTYTPPHDPPSTPGELENADLNAGFSESMEATDPDREILPEDLNDNDLELRNSIFAALQSNSETMHLTNIDVRVEDGVVTLLGTVEDENDIAMIDEILSDMMEIKGVHYRMDTAY